MAKTTYYIDNADPASIDGLLDAFEVSGGQYEKMIRTALSLHEQPFLLEVDPAGQTQLSPLQDQFSFDMKSDALQVFTDNAAILIDAIVQMAMFQRGFNTMLGVEDEWKIHVAMGAWRQVREVIKRQYNLNPSYDKDWTASLDLDTVEQFDLVSFGTIVFLASRPDVEAVFPPGASALVISAYERLVRIMETIALDVGLDDYLVFNRRLNRALLLIEESILPKDSSPFDDLFGPEGFSDHYFDDNLDG